MWVGVGVVAAIQMESRSRADKTQRFHEMKGNCYMARVINFYIPKNFRRPLALRYSRFSSPTTVIFVSVRNFL